MITPEHRAYLNASAITDEVIGSQEIDSIERGIVFPWRSPDGEETWQLRPDIPELDLETGRPVKYVWPTDTDLMMNRLRDAGTGPVLIVEGTKQQFAALSWAPPEYAVYGLSGCWGWVDGGRATWLPDVMFLMGRDVYVCFDADMETNYQVHCAAKQLSDQLKRSGVGSVRYVQTTARDTNGLDDVLAALPEDRRTAILALWISQATARLPKAPKKPPSHPFIAENGALLVKRATEAVMKRAPAALTVEGKVALYSDGVFQLNPLALLSGVVDLLGDLYRKEWRKNIEETAVGLLYLSGTRLPERSTEPLLNVANGMLDLVTGELKPHDPVYMSSAQLPVEWLPEAKAPTYEWWLNEVIPDQIEDLEEVASTMLDPSRTPSKALFAFGVSRSGKSTFIRLIQAIAGERNQSAVTLHALAENRFAAANVYGKILNASSDLSSAEVTDLSLFKMMTGDDLIMGEEKYASPFAFRNRALFAFCANELPTVGETSRAYLERIKPFRFGLTFAGHEDPLIEVGMMNELPGILVRLVAAWQRFHARGGYSPTLPEVRVAFEVGSNRVRQWISEEMEVTDAAGKNEVARNQGTTGAELHRLFGAWTEIQKAKPMGRKAFIAHLTSVNAVKDVRIMPNRSRGFNVVQRTEDSKRGQFGQLSTIVEGSADVCKESVKMISNEPKTGVFHSLDEDVEKPARTARSARTVPHPFVFDLETASVAELHTRDPFVKIGGYTDSDGRRHIASGGAGVFNIVMSTALANGQPYVAGHNISGFDLVALAKKGLRLDLLKGRTWDTKLAEYILDPPLSGKKGTIKMPHHYYGLDNTCLRRGLPSKTDDLAGLAKKHGGYHLIPDDDPEYRSYLQGDVIATTALLNDQLEDLSTQPELMAYVRRDMDVSLPITQMTVNGFRLDIPELEKIIAEQGERKSEHLSELVDLIGLPLGKTIKFKRIPDRFEPYKSPLASPAGKACVEQALTDAGINVDRLPRTDKSGELQISGEAMGDLLQSIRGSSRRDPKIERMLELVVEQVGERTVYESAYNGRALAPDGTYRYHPSIAPTQASGRWSVSLLTVFGKRNGKHVERRVFDADEGQSIITIDLNQIDARILAGLSQDPGYMAIFQDPNADLHEQVAQAVFGDRSMREQAKAISHGWNYGESVNTMIRNGADPSLAAQFDREMRLNYPRLVEWQEEMRAIARSGQLLDNGWGRPMRADPQFAYTQGAALPGQGGTRDALGQGLLNLDPDLWKYLRVVIHDEVAASVPTADAEEIGREIVKAFTFDFRGVPITAGCSKPAPNWALAYDKEFQRS
jgi:P4 family phage/plasmid primase-like protien